MKATSRWLGALLLAVSLPCVSRAQYDCDVIWYSAALCTPLGRAPDFCSICPTYGVDCHGCVVGPLYNVYPPFAPVGTFPPFQDVSKLPKYKKPRRQSGPPPDEAAGGPQNPAAPTPPTPPMDPGFGQFYPPQAGVAQGPPPGYPGPGQAGPTFTGYSGYRGPASTGPGVYPVQGYGSPQGYAAYPVPAYGGQPRYPTAAGYAGPGVTPAGAASYTQGTPGPLSYQGAAVAGAYAARPPLLLVQAPNSYVFPMPNTPPTPPTPLMPRPPQVLVQLPQTPQPPVPPPTPMYMPQVAPGAGVANPTHPYARSPRDFFMWTETYEDQANRRRFPVLVP